MSICLNCGKKANKIAWSRHKKGSSGHGGQWNLKAQISKRVQKPNLHTFKGRQYCTKCLRIVKVAFIAIKKASDELKQVAAVS